VQETRGVGLMGAFQLREGEGIASASQLKAMAEEEGVIVRAVPIGASLALSPPLIITEAEISEVFDRIEKTLARAQTHPGR
jgi:Adenosylmethionine-8-amino-7-oxononanoate aminotransferase